MPENAGSVNVPPYLLTCRSVRNGIDGTTLKPLYTVPEFAALIGTHRKRADRLLQAAGVQFQRVGRIRYVTLAELMRRAEDLVESAQLARFFLERAKRDLSAEIPAE